MGQAGPPQPMVKGEQETASESVDGRDQHGHTHAPPQFGPTDAPHTPQGQPSQQANNKGHGRQPQNHLPKWVRTAHQVGQELDEPPSPSHKKGRQDE